MTRGRAFWIAIACVLSLRWFAAEPYLMTGVSMHPTFHSLEYILVEKVSRSRERGDVIVFREPETGQKAMKRIIALPGETFRMGEKAWTLGRGEYFLLGDQREASTDSRHWGPISEDAMVGRPLLRIYPFDRIEFFPGRSAPGIVHASSSNTSR